MSLFHEISQNRASDRHSGQTLAVKAALAMESLSGNSPSWRVGRDAFQEISKEPTVFVVDPDAATRNSIRELAGTMSLLCEAYGSGQEFVEALRESDAGCVILEIKIPGIGGIQIQRILKERGNDIPVIFLTAHPELSIAVEAMRSGAVHFLEKPFRSNEVWNAIQEAVELDQERRRDRVWQRLLCKRLTSLTSKEREVLSLIAQGQSNRQIAARMRVCVRTVEVHRAALARKLDVSSLWELLNIAIAFDRAAPAENEPPSSRAGIPWR